MVIQIQVWENRHPGSNKTMAMPVVTTSRGAGMISQVSAHARSRRTRSKAARPPAWYARFCVTAMAKPPPSQAMPARM